MKNKVSVIPSHVSVLIFGIVGLFLYSIQSPVSSAEESKDEESKDIVITIKSSDEVIVADGAGRPLKPQQLKYDSPPETSMMRMPEGIEEKLKRLGVKNPVYMGCGEVSPGCMCCVLGGQVLFNPEGCGSQ